MSIYTFYYHCFVLWGDHKKAAHFFSSATAHQVLRNSKLYLEDFERLSDMKVENHALSAIHGSYATIKSIDLTSIKRLGLHTTGTSGGFEVHIDSLTGRQIAQFTPGPKVKEGQDLSSPALEVNGRHDLYLLYVNRDLRFQPAPVEWLSFNQ